MVMVALVVSFLVIKFVLIGRSHASVGASSSRHLPALPVPQFIYYGGLACNGGVVIPGNSLIVLVYHVHGNMLINYVNILIDVPLTVINYSLPGAVTAWHGYGYGCLFKRHLNSHEYSLTNTDDSHHRKHDIPTRQ